jgi:hypothetical protein
VTAEQRALSIERIVLHPAESALEQREIRVIDPIELQAQFLSFESAL